MNEKIMIRNVCEYPGLIPLSDEERMRCIQHLCPFKLDSATLDFAKDMIRGKITLKKGSLFSMQYGDVAILVSGAMYTYYEFCDDEKQMTFDMVSCLLHKALYKNMEIPIIPNNEYIPSLTDNLSYKEYIQKCENHNQEWEVFLKASGKSKEDVSLLIVNLKEHISNAAVIKALFQYYMQFANMTPDLFNAFKQSPDQKISTLYEKYPDLQSNFTVEVLTNFWNIAKTTWYNNQ